MHDNNEVVEATQVTEVVTKVYWQCCVATHRHRTQRVAQECIEAYRAPKKQRRKWDKALHASMFKAVLNGESYRAVGKKSGLTGQRIAGIVSKMRRVLLKPQRLHGVKLNDERWGDFVFWTQQGTAGMRKHKDFWIPLADKFSKEVA